MRMSCPFFHLPPKFAAWCWEHAGDALKVSYFPTVLAAGPLHLDWMRSSLCGKRSRLTTARLHAIECTVSAPATHRRARTSENCIAIAFLLARTTFLKLDRPEFDEFLATKLKGRESFRLTEDDCGPGASTSRKANGRLPAVRHSGSTVRRRILADEGGPTTGTGTHVPSPRTRAQETTHQPRGASWQDYDGAGFVFHKLRVFGRLRVVFADSAYGRNGLPAWSRKPSDGSCRPCRGLSTRKDLSCCPNDGSWNELLHGWLAAAAIVATTSGILKPAKL